MKKLILTLSLVFSFIAAPVMAASTATPGIDAVEAVEATDGAIIVIIFDDCIVVIVVN